MTRNVLLAALLLAACRPEPVARAAARDGQWVWSAADAALLAPARGARAPGRLPGVWVATVRPAPSGDSLVTALALSPRSAGPGPIAAVIRFDASLHAWWDGVADAAAARALGDRLDALLSLLDASGAPVAEVQLDYDCPVRLLPRWSKALHRLRRGPLAGREVWLTSLAAHQRDPAFGRRLRGAVDGQIVQLFDTGARPGEAALTELERLIPRQGLPFRVGLGAFERRVADGRMTDHAGWFGAVARLRSLPGYRGLWVFPAGQPYEPLLGAAP